jgi:hypothetical protein
MKIFAVILVAACFTVSIAGAYIGVYYLPPPPTTENTASGSAPDAGAEVQPQENQPIQTNPSTKPTPIPTPQEETVTMHVYTIIRGGYDYERNSNLTAGLKQLGDYYAISCDKYWTSADAAIGDGSSTAFTFALYKPATTKQYEFMEKNANYLGVGYETVEVSKSVVAAYEQAKWKVEQGLDNSLPQSGIK